MFVIKYKFMHLLIMFFFFKQKTAYEMRISDWISDVCSSDLQSRGTGNARDVVHPCRAARHAGDRGSRPRHRIRGKTRQSGELSRGLGSRYRRVQIGDRLFHGRSHRRRKGETLRLVRSEEHTSELQSLMRIAYAVFCLKKKKTKKA